MVYLLGTALRKPVFSTGSGHCWIKVGQHGDVTRVRRWIATAHAFGHHFMYAYKKWGFSKETGTQWYITPIATYRPLCRFITEHADLFDGCEPVAQVGVLYDNRACRNHHWEVRDICRELHDASISCGLAIAGDGWLRHELTREELQRFELIVIPPHAASSGRQGDLIKEARRQGRAVDWANAEHVRARIRRHVSLSDGNKIWALPRRAVNGPLVIHLLNQDYDSDKDRMREKSGVEVRICEGLTKRPTRVTVFAPGDEPADLPMARREDGVTVIVPKVDLWAILRVE